MATAMDTEGAGLRETSSLIASDKVEGTPVRRANGDTLGQIERLVIEKRSGRVAYAIMSFGGFLGMGEQHYAIPWSKLRYDVGVDAYQVDLTDEQIKGAPAFSRGSLAGSRDNLVGGPQDPSSDPGWEAHVARYFNAEPHPGEPIESATHEAQGGR